MEEIFLNKINKQGNMISFDFTVTEGLACYFSGKPFVIEYPENIEAVPDAVAAVPFVCNVLPIIWLTDSKLIVPELDKAFYDCIPNVKKGYEEMFPEAAFDGHISVEHVVPHDRPASGRSAAFFSGGLDAVNTLIQHISEKPDLISIWGADIAYSNEEGWTPVQSAIEEVAQQFALNSCIIRTSFREFDIESELERKFQNRLKDGWWHGVKHGIGLLGHAAPYVYLHGHTSVYIASSNSPADGKVRCASNPLTDNHVRYANCRVIHDGFEFDRQDKTRNIIDFCNQNGFIPLHVCWESQSGNNCCNCEKCFRTMVGLWVEGADPMDFGFAYGDDIFERIYQYIGLYSHAFRPKHWNLLKKTLRNNWVELEGSSYQDNLKWMLDFDFDNLEKNPCRKKIRIIALKTRIVNAFPDIYKAYKRMMNVLKHNN